MNRIRNAPIDFHRECEVDSLPGRRVIENMKHSTEIGCARKT